MEWILEEDPEIVVSSGPAVETKIGEFIEWDIHSRQGVYLFSDQNTDRIIYDFQMDINKGYIRFKSSTS